MHAGMAAGVLRWEGRGIGCRKAGELNAKLCIYLVRLHPNIAQRRASLWLDFLARAKVHAHADGGSLIPRRSFLKIVTVFTPHWAI